MFVEMDLAHKARSCPKAQSTNLLLAPFGLILCCDNLDTIHTINIFFGICWFYFGVCLMLNRFGFLSEVSGASNSNLAGSKR